MAIPASQASPSYSEKPANPPALASSTLRPQARSFTPSNPSSRTPPPPSPQQGAGKGDTSPALPTDYPKQPHLAQRGGSRTSSRSDSSKGSPRGYIPAVNKPARASDADLEAKMSRMRLASEAATRKYEAAEQDRRAHQAEIDAEEAFRLREAERRRLEDDSVQRDRSAARARKLGTMAEWDASKGDPDADASPRRIAETRSPRDERLHQSDRRRYYYVEDAEDEEYVRPRRHRAYASGYEYEDPVDVPQALRARAPSPALSARQPHGSFDDREHVKRSPAASRSPRGSEYEDHGFLAEDVHSHDPRRWHDPRRSTEPRAYKQPTVRYRLYPEEEVYRSDTRTRRPREDMGPVRELERITTGLPARGHELRAARSDDLFTPPHSPEPQHVNEGVGPIRPIIPKDQTWPKGQRNQASTFSSGYGIRRRHDDPLDSMDGNALTRYKIYPAPAPVAPPEDADKDWEEEEGQRLGHSEVVPLRPAAWRPDPPPHVRHQATPARPHDNIAETTFVESVPQARIRTAAAPGRSAYIPWDGGVVYQDESLNKQVEMTREELLEGLAKMRIERDARLEPARPLRQDQSVPRSYGGGREAGDSGWESRSGTGDANEQDTGWGKSGEEQHPAPVQVATAAASPSVSRPTLAMHPDRARLLGAVATDPRGPVPARATRDAPLPPSDGGWSSRKPCVFEVNEPSPPGHASPANEQAQVDDEFGGW